MLVVLTMSAGVFALAGCDREVSRSGQAPPPAAPAKVRAPARTGGAVGSPHKKKETKKETSRRAVATPDSRPIPDAALLKPGAIFRLRIETWRRRASVEVLAADGQKHSGRTPWTLRLPAGATRISISRRRHRTAQRTVVLSKDTELQACLDPQDQLVRCRRMIRCGMAPKGALLNADGSKVWVANLHSVPPVQVFATATGELLAGIIPTRHGAVELEFSHDGSKVYTSQIATNQVHELDRRTYKVLRSFQTRGAMSKVIKIAADHKSLFVSNWMGNNVSQIDLSTGEVLRRLPTVITPRGMYPTPDGKHLYVAGFRKGNLHKIDLATGKGKIVFSGGRTLRHVVGDSRDRRLYISDMYLNVIFELDRATDEVKRFARTNRYPNTIALSPDDKILYVSNRGSHKKGDYRKPGPRWGSVLLLDTATGKVLDAIVGGNQPTALDVSDDGKVLVFSDFLDHRLRVYDIPPHEQLVKGGGGRALSHKRELPKKNF